MNISQIKSKTVPIVLQDGKERHLRFTLNALALLEEKYGSVDKAFEIVQSGSSIIALRYLLWAGLSWEDDALTEEKVGDLIDIAYMGEMIDKLGNAMTDSMPTEEQVQQAQQAQQVLETKNIQAAKLNDGENPN